VDEVQRSGAVSLVNGRDVTGVFHLRLVKLGEQGVESRR
jgi:hypothetical protein